MQVKTCSICGKREAVVKRAISGEYICKPCLDKVVKKNAKRSLAKTRILKEGMRIIVHTTWLAPTPSLIAARIVSRIESRYRTKLYLAVPSDMMGYLDAGVESLYEGIIPYDYTIEGGGIGECLEKDISSALENALKQGAEAVITPYPLFLLAKTGLYSMFSGNKSLLHLSKPVQNRSGIPLVSALYNMESELITLYAHVNGIPLLDPKPACRDYGAREVLLNVLGESREVEFNTLKTLIRLSELL